MWDQQSVRPERWLTNDSIALWASRMVGVMHHFVGVKGREGKGLDVDMELTFFFCSASARRSARAASWDLRFLRRVSGTRTWSLVGMELCRCEYSLSV